MPVEKQGRTEMYKYLPTQGQPECNAVLPLFEGHSTSLPQEDDIKAEGSRKDPTLPTLISCPPSPP